MGEGEEKLLKMAAELYRKLSEYFIVEDHGELDELDFYELAEEVGLLHKVEYKESEHGEVEDVEEGDLIFAHSEFGRALLAVK